MAKNGFTSFITNLEKKMDKPRVTKVLILFAFAFYLLGLVVYAQSMEWKLGTEIIALFGIIALAVSLFLKDNVGPLVYGGGLAVIAAAHVAGIFSTPIDWAGSVVGSGLVIAVSAILAALLLAAATHFFLKGKPVGFLPKLIISTVGLLLMLVMFLVKVTTLFNGHDAWDYDSVQHASTVFIAFALGAMALVWLVTAFHLPFRKDDDEDLFAA